MAVVCYICKKEVHLVRFGSGFVGTCCNGVVYNSIIKPQFVMKQEEQKNVSIHSVLQKRRSYQAKHS